MATNRGGGDRLSKATSTLARAERTVTARLGAGQPFEAAFRPPRWVRELAEDMSCTPDAAAAIIAALAERLRDATAPSDSPRGRVAAAHLVFAHCLESLRSGASPGEGDGAHMVYQLFTASDVLLYVGITSRGPVRLAEHYRHKPWFSQVANVRFERFGTLAESAERERYLISTFAPLHNVQHNQGRQIA